jgi:predicted ArsR family transcriptional regulator
MTGDKDVEQRHAALASQSRRAVLALLAESHKVLDAAAIAVGIGLHVTTVRFHLEQLESAGLVRRELSRDGQRGRPRVLFGITAAAAARSDEGHRQLAEVLADALSSDPDGGKTRATAAGERWADMSTADLAVDPGGDVVAPLVTMLDRLGFDPELTGEGEDRIINLLACPFRDTAVSHPEVVCSVHRGLIQRTLSSFGREGDTADLLPFVQTELCVIPLHLSRAD